MIEKKFIEAKLRKRYPILEFDPTRRAIIEPNCIIKPANVPERCVVCFFQEVIDAAVKRKRAKIAGRLKSEIGFHPLYEIKWRGERVAVFHPGVGAAMAAALTGIRVALFTVRQRAKSSFGSPPKHACCYNSHLLQIPLLPSG